MKSFLDQACSAFEEYLETLGLDFDYVVFRPVFIDGFIQSQAFDSVEVGLQRYEKTFPEDILDQAKYTILKFYVSGFALGKMHKVNFFEPYTMN